MLSRREEIKKELNSIKAQIYVFTSQIGEINKGRFEQLLSEKQLLDKKELLGELIDQRDTLSSFAGKQKKLLQEQIDVLKEQLSELEVIIAQQKAEIEAKSAERINQLKADSKPLRDREEALKTEMEEINRELAKAR